MYWRYKMRKMRLVLILVAAVMLIITASSCGKKTTEPDDVPTSMVYVRGGSFIMGNTRGELFPHEYPTHTVTLSSFYIGKYEVTQVEYSLYMLPSHEWSNEDGLGDNYPAYNISWYDAIKYCNLRSRAEGLNSCYTIDGSKNPADWGEVPNHFAHPNRPTWDAVICDFNANGYRLPTEAEWEFAARGRTNDPNYLYSGSDDINAVAWYYETAESLMGSRPVGQKAPNSLGIYDMSGNVEEWCWDWFGGYSENPQTNPTGPDGADGMERMMRGGYWDSSAEMCRVSCRIPGDPSWPFFTQGLRVCRTKK